ncbi:MAG: hypothetical protein H6620_05775 [Halobacteriovoraceae bacterium]|nr:hypothetical protein [Halobacteriovoraceae bacterium]
MKANQKHSPMIDETNITFNKCGSESDLKKLYDYDVDVFAEAGDFEWSLKNLRKEKNDGWDIYSVSLSNDNEIIAALFVKKDGADLLTKNTSVKISHQGKGISHRIKEFFENKAIENHSKNIIHFCAVDNFRNIALNESHGYVRDSVVNKGEVIKWRKKMT